MLRVRSQENVESEKLGKQGERNVKKCKEVQQKKLDSVFVCWHEYALIFMVFEDIFKHKTDGLYMQQWCHVRPMCEMADNIQVLVCVCALACSVSAC